MGGAQSQGRQPGEEPEGGGDRWVRGDRRTRQRQAAIWSPRREVQRISEIARDIQDGVRDFARLLPSLNGEEPLQRIVQLQEQLDGLTAAAAGRARYRRRGLSPVEQWSTRWAAVAAVNRPV
ncbi:hypothetical protein [Streptomyces mexicanus]|uniref:hypothetical protein n=1 Tax=Streptomyces mexicanus TaxID=178566 RepID=UPI003662A106